MSKEIKGDQNLYELKHIAFLLKLLRIFIMAAFSTSADSQIYTAVSLMRRSSSSVQDEDSTLASLSKPLSEVAQAASGRFAELQKLLAGPIGE